MKTCLYCERPLKAAQKKFCSNRCHALHRGPKGRKLRLICQQCGQPFETYESMNLKFCSRMCYAQSRVGQPSPHRRTPLHSNGIGGFREDLGSYFRSRWEANYARILRMLNTPFVYEECAFVVTLPDGSASSYCPDFFVEGQYVEIKGYWRSDRRERERVTAFRAQYPDTPVRVIGPAEYRALEAQYAALIPAWEYRGSDPPHHPVKSCPVCGTVITSIFRRTIYCSRQCAGIAKRTPGSTHSEPRRWKN